MADAVAFEPVSTLKFPANREKNRNFVKLACWARFCTKSSPDEVFGTHRLPMSAMGHKRTAQNGMSALPPKATRQLNVR